MQTRFGNCFCLTEGDQYSLLLFLDLVGGAEDYYGSHNQKHDGAKESA